tara:strand:+ start:44 stop:376 length:333 start_codon:yes stop_codon:yes gene_type:complete
MANLSSKVVEYCKSNGVNSVDFLEQVLLQDNSDGAGPFIAEWNLEIPQPSMSDLDAFDSAASDAEYNASQIDKRVAEYGSAAEQLEILVEQGAEALASRNNAIKAKYEKK